MPHRSIATIFSLHAAAITTSLVGMALSPPRSGAMLLVPLLHQNVDSVAILARASGAMLVGKGPLPGSLVVVGDRSRIAGHFPTGGVLILASLPTGCGDPSALETVA
jgi:hypothetical protein